jgi:CubicO group peptidase (beta-lactamase class C family)
MSETLRRPFKLAAVLLGVLLLLPRSALAGAPADLESGLKVPIGGITKTLTLSEAMAVLNIPSVSIALIDQDRIAFASAYGQGAAPETLFQAASLSKFVAAIGAMRLVDQKRLALDDDVNAGLTSWHVPANVLDKDHPVTLRGLLSMTAGVGVMGFLGYELGAPLPTLTQILDGTPPANSAPVTVIAVPGSSYHYSGGSYEIAEALIVDTLRTQFIETMDDLVLKPAGMSHSTFAQPLPEEFRAKAVSGHLGDGTEVKGGLHVFPEHAAAGLWSTPTDIANLLLLIGRAWRGESALFLTPDTAREMLKAQNGGPYGLGAAIAESEGALIVMKRGQNVGYQSYLILIPGDGQGMVVMTNSDNGSILAEALIRRAAETYGWPALPAFAD